MSESHDANDEALSALIDGALEPDAAARLRQRMARDAALAERFAQLVQASAAAKAAYGPVADEPLPERALALLREGAPSAAANEQAPVTERGAPNARARRVVALKPRPQRARWLASALPAALAAGIALAIGIALGVAFAPRGRGPDAAVLAAGAIEPGSALRAVLEKVPSGASREIAPGVRATPRLSFATTAGDYCRRVDLAGERGTSAALACMHGGEWRITAAAATSDAGGGAYRPAAEAPNAIDAAIDERIDGEPLTPEAEAALIASGWRAAAR